jgi:hypothetical protein
MMHSLDGGTEVSEDSAVVLYIGFDVAVLDCQHQESIDVKGNRMIFLTDG